MENAIGAHLRREPGLSVRLLSPQAHLRLYRFALQRGNLDAALFALIVNPFKNIFLWCDRLERKWTDFLSGGGRREAGRGEAKAEIVEKLRL
jgi:NAD(P)H-quinone oxidoreductase subunit 5